LISAPSATSTIFGAFQAISKSPNSYERHNFRMLCSVRQSKSQAQGRAEKRIRTVAILRHIRVVRPPLA
jgi:hypothetical protein